MTPAQEYLWFRMNAGPLPRTRKEPTERERRESAEDDEGQPKTRRRRRARPSNSDEGV
ncbi:hypothetical protein CBM2634_A80240 [Cupriavidus taiwanensis]|uniref:Uncharacterized protein n=1 Tax=Cupriavidus taiwanensis TaxID=164546 RepID=A0A375J288_9BURK|nr:hypothetical protein CBM2634_A80240 [Cupriavidus taiwanensis]